MSEYDIAASTTTTLAVIASLIFVLVAAYVYEALPRLPGKLSNSGSVPLCADEIFGDHTADRRFRDLAHVLENGELRILNIKTGRLTSVPPPPSEGKHLHVAGSKHEADLHEYLMLALQRDGLGDSCPIACRRVSDMLSFVPAKAVLRSAGVSPNLRSHRFVVIHGTGVLRTLATGHIEADGALLHDEAALQLIVVSPNLLECGDCAASACHVQYVVRARRRWPWLVPKQLPSIDDEMHRCAGRWCTGRW